MNTAGQPDASSTDRARVSRRAARVVYAYLVLPHAAPVLVVLAATLGFALIATDGDPSLGQLIRLLLAMLGAQIAIGASNELMDADLDARVKPEKPIPAGLVSSRGAATVIVVGVVAMASISAGFGWLSFGLCAAGMTVGIAYSRWFKRTRLAWLPYLVALPLLPIWVWAALDKFEPDLLLLYPLGAFAVIGVYLSQSLPDIAADRAGGVRNLTAILGERRSILACWAATLAAAALAALLAPALADAPRYAWAAAVIGLVLVAINASLYLANTRLGVMACFPCMAVATAVMGIGWVLAASP